MSCEQRELKAPSHDSPHATHYRLTPKALPGLYPQGFCFSLSLKIYLPVCLPTYY
jgi:hypothetical protein